MMSQRQNVRVLFAERAGRLNEGSPQESTSESLAVLAASGWLGLGVPEDLGGSGGSLLDAIEAIATVSEECLTSGFIFWCQQAFIQCLVASDNTWLHEQILPKALQGEWSGTTALFNGMEYLGQREQPVTARLEPTGFTLNGFLPWVPNLNPNGFGVVLAARASTGRSLIVAVPSSVRGLDRGEDLQLLGLQGSGNSTLHLAEARLPHTWIVSDNAADFLEQIRPTLLLLQCGLALGILRRSVQECLQSVNRANEEVLGDRLKYTVITLASLESTLWKLGRLRTLTPDRAREVLELRLALTRLAMDAVWLELEAKGGSGYFRPSGTARRLREVAFLPVLSPSLVQLEIELMRSAKSEEFVGLSDWR